MVETLVDAAAYPIQTLTKFAQALGGLIAVSIIFGVVNVLMNHRRAKELKGIREELSRMKKMLGKKEKKD